MEDVVSFPLLPKKFFRLSLHSFIHSLKSNFSFLILLEPLLTVDSLIFILFVLRGHVIN